MAAGADGSLLVTPADDPAAGAISLPADYVARHVELAYATTVHRSQGRTAERAGTVRRLADEYTTIAAGDAADGWQIALPALLPHAAAALRADPHYDALCALLRRRAAAGVDVRTALPRLAGPDRPLDPARPAADLAGRVGRLRAPAVTGRACRGGAGPARG